MPVKFLKGLSTTLKNEKESPEYKDGQIIFTTDDRRLYIDHRTDPLDLTSVKRLPVAAGGATFFVSKLLTKNGIEDNTQDFIDCSFLEKDRNYKFIIDYQPEEKENIALNFKYRCDIMKANFNAILEKVEEKMQIKITIPEDIEDDTIRANVLFWEIENTEES